MEEKDSENWLSPQKKKKQNYQKILGELPLVKN